MNRTDLWDIITNDHPTMNSGFHVNGCHRWNRELNPGLSGDSTLRLFLALVPKFGVRDLDILLWILIVNVIAFKGIKTLFSSYRRPFSLIYWHKLWLIFHEKSYFCSSFWFQNLRSGTLISCCEYSLWMKLYSKVSKTLFGLYWRPFSYVHWHKCLIFHTNYIFVQILLTIWS